MHRSEALTSANILKFVLTITGRSLPPPSLKAVAVLLFVAQLLFPLSGHGQASLFNPSHTVVPITTVKLGAGLGVVTRMSFGSGFCLDTGCQYIGTNYHVAIQTGSSLKIKGQTVAERYLDSGPDDDGAKFNDELGPAVRPMKFNPRRDLALYVLKRPLANVGLHGIAFSSDELEENREVDIYAYPLADRFNLKRSLTMFPGRFVGTTEDGLLEFKYEPSESGRMIKGGASGGLVIDRKTQQVVGILNGASNSSELATAVSVASLAEFLDRVTPKLYGEMFSQVKPGDAIPMEQALADVYPRYIPNANDLSTLVKRPKEPPEVELLRQKAQELTESVSNFIAIQTTTYGGMRTPPHPMQFEIRVVDGAQRFRPYPGGTTELLEAPMPEATELGASNDWSMTPSLLGTDLNLRIIEDAEVNLGQRHVKIFRYYGTAEDKACTFEHIDDYILFKHTTRFKPSCGGEVWTDENLNIMRISTIYDLPSEAQWKGFHAVATYGWLDRPGDTKRLVPMHSLDRAEYKGKTYWCHLRFTNYRVFSTRSKLLQPEGQESSPLLP